LACGDEGAGRMREPEEIIAYASAVFSKNKDYAGKHLLITAGPTWESIDAVRYITNRSTGKMGYALAEAAYERGACVTLVSGPVDIQPKYGIKLVPVTTAEEMYRAVMRHYPDSDIVIKAAAVADYRPETQEQIKIKKTGDMSLALVRTKDILKELGQKKGDKLLIGFAAETEDIERHAKEKLKNKNLDLIAANDIREKGAGFAGDTNHIILYKKNGEKKDLGVLTKYKTAHAVLTEILGL